MTVTYILWYHYCWKWPAAAPFLLLTDS